MDMPPEVPKISRLPAEGSINRTLFELAFPILCTNVLQTLNGSINSIWVGRYLGEEALAAVSNAHLVIFLLTGAILGVAMAATILIGHSAGAGNIAAAKRVTGASTTFFAGISVVLAISGQASSEALLTLLGAPVESFTMAVAYMKVMFLAVPSIYMYLFVASILRGVGDSKTPLYFMMLTVGIDILLNPLFIFGLGPIPGAGIVGSAFAILGAYAVSLAAIVTYVYRRRHPLCLRKGDLPLLRVNWNIIRTLLRKGIPMSTEVLVISLSSVLMIGLVNRFGVDTTAAFGASLQLWTYVQMPAIAIGMAVTTMTALNMGSQRSAHVWLVGRAGTAWGVVLTAFMIILIEILGTYLYRLFLPAGSMALPIADHINRVVGWSFLCLSISTVLFGVVRATGAVEAPLAIHTMTLLVIRFSVAAVLVEYWHADGIWWSFSLSSVLAALLAILYYRYGSWRAATVRAY